MNGTLNKVMLIGNVGDEIKMHYSENGNCVGRFPLATDESYTNKNGDRISHTEWHSITVFNKAAEICEKYLKKGDKVYIEGKVRTNKWQDDKGIDRYSTEIQCKDFTFLTPKGESNTVSNNTSAQNTPKPEPSLAPQNNNSASEEKGDLPF